MGQCYNSTVIDAPLEKVWSTLRDFHDMGWANEVIETVEKVGTCSGTTAGAKRILNNAIYETLLSINDADHTFTYSIDDGPGPIAKKSVTNYVGSVKVFSITDDGKTDMFSELMISILSTMSDFERKMIRERQMEGIKIRKEKGLYKGRQIGTTDSVEKFLNKPKSIRILKDLENGYGIREISEMRDCSYSTIYKVKRLSEEKELV